MPESTIWLNDESVIRETEAAILIENSRGENVWLPKSQLSFYDDGSIGVPQWLADEREIE